MAIVVELLAETSAKLLERLAESDVCEGVSSAQRQRERTAQNLGASTKRLSCKEAEATGAIRLRLDVRALGE